MSIPSQLAGAVRPASPPLSAGAVAPRALLHTLLVAGARGAAREETSSALTRYWQELQSSSVTQRQWVATELRAAVRTGETTNRAWLPVALGETEAELVGQAVLGYLGVAPVSIERRELAIRDVLEWIRRGLALNRAAIFVALLQLEDPAVNERLAGLRGRLTGTEAMAVWHLLTAADGPLAGDFIADWRLHA